MFTESEASTLKRLSGTPCPPKPLQSPSCRGSNQNKVGTRAVGGPLPDAGPRWWWSHGLFKHALLDMSWATHPFQQRGWWVWGWLSLHPFSHVGTNRPGLAQRGEVGLRGQRGWEPRSHLGSQGEEAKASPVYAKPH